MELFFGIAFALFFELFLLGILRFFGFYTIVPEARCQVLVLFGKVIMVLDKPGLYILWPRLGWKAMVINMLGRIYTLDMRLDQVYLRSQPVNSEEGAPMGIGIWYEMFISDPVAFLFKNADPVGSLAANVSNATVRCLSNMPLSHLLEDRHDLSVTVRSEVTGKSHEWGYKLGSVYIRKVHFRDLGMINQIESKVVNRLRQVTAAIRQDGENQVNIITSSAQRTAATEFAKAAAIRPKIVGEAMHRISKDPEVSAALFETLETQRVLDSNCELTLIPKDGGILQSLLATTPEKGGAAASSQGYVPIRESGQFRH